MIPDEQSERVFYRGAVLAFPCALALLVFLPSFAAIAMMALFYGGIPYAVWAFLQLRWMKDRPIDQIRKALLVAPVTYFIAGRADAGGMEGDGGILYPEALMKL